VWAGLAGFGWGLSYSFTGPLVAFHVVGIAHIWYNDPVKHPRVKLRMDMLGAIGVFFAAAGVWSVDGGAVYGCVAYVTWVVAFVFYSQKLAGVWSSMIFHILLSIPQVCMLHAASLN